MEPLLIPINQGFAALGVGRSKGYEIVKQGKLTVIKIGAKSLLDVRQIKALAAEIVASARSNSREAA